MLPVAGGGTLFIPEGHYRVDGPIKLKGTVQLRGRWCAPHDGTDELGYTYAEKLGSVICIENTGTEEATITASTIQDLTFWYPNQTPEAELTAYPWTIMKKVQSPKAYYHRITLLNAYKGVYVAEGSAADVRHIYGSAYETGIRVNPNYALAQFENFNFSPEYLEWSGLASGSAITAHRVATRAGGSAIEMSRVGVGSYVKEHRVGFTCFKVDGQGNMPLRSVGNADLRDCQIGVLFNYGNTGWNVTGSTVTNCDIAVSAPYGGNLNIDNSKLLDSAVYDADGVTNKLDVAIVNGSIADPDKMNLNGGSVTDNAFEEEEADDDPDSELDEEFETKLTVPAYTADSRDLEVWDVFNVKDPEFGAMGDGLHDDTAAVQAAIAAANANGGGVVMFPGGHYRVTTNLTTLGAGVELRGALDWRVLQNTPQLGSYLWPDIPDFADNEENEEAFIRLGDRSGVRGMSFYYPNQVGGSPFKKYPFTIQGNGVRNYVVYCSAVNPYRFINFNGDDNLLAHSFPTAQREVVFVNGNRDGRFIRNNPKPYWDASFPRPASAESYVREITREGMVLLHLKDCDDYGSAWGSYCHAGYLGLLVENSGGNLGRLSFEAFRNGHLFASGDKEMILCDKNSSRPRPGPIDGEETFYIKTLEGFEGKVIAHSGSCNGSFAKTLDVQGGTVHTVGGKMTDQTPQVVVVGEKGSLIVEDKTFKDPVMVRNEGSMKLIGSIGLNMLNDPYAWEYEADNGLEKVAAYSHMGFWPVRAFGLVAETNGLEFVPGVEDVPTQPYSKGITKTTNGVFEFTLEDPAFLNESPNPVVLVFDGTVPAGCTLQASYYSQGSWVDLAAKTYSNSTATVSFTLPSPSFGQQLPEHSDLPDIRLSVLAGDSPSWEHVQVKTDLYGTSAPTAPSGLAAAAGSLVILDWDDHEQLDITYNVYRRETASGAFGAPLATHVLGSTYEDETAAAGVSNYWYVVTAVNKEGQESAISFDTDTNWQPEPVIVTDELPSASLNEDYTVNLLAAGEAPFTWSLVDGALPQGLTLSSDGTLSGLPVVVGRYIFEIAVADGVGGEVATHTYSLAVTPQELLVFFDDFDNDGLGANTGIGGGLWSKVIAGGPNFADDGDLSANSTAGNNRGLVYTSGSFDLSGGFELEVAFNVSRLGTSANRLEIGLLNASSSIGSLGRMPFAEAATDFSSVGNGSDIYGIGAALLAKDPVGLHFVDGATATRTRIEDNTSQAVTANTDVTMILTMDASGNYTYDLSGNAQTVASSGTISGFDLSEPFHFVVGHQDNEVRKEIRSVTLYAVQATNQPPVFTGNPIVETDADKDIAYSGTIADDASDPESDPMTFSLVTTGTWLSVASDGTLSGTPTLSDIGLNSFIVQVDAMGGIDTTMLEINVIPPPDTTPPAFPMGLNAVADDGSVSLDWADNSEPDLASYIVYRSTTSGSYGAALVTGLTASHYVDRSAANGTTYYYVVSAVDTNSHESARSAEVSATPVQPGTQIVYQDSFDNDGVDTNTGIGGGLTAKVIWNGPNFVDDGDLSANSTGGNNRGLVYTSGSFDLSDGFELEVVFNVSANGGSANRFEIGLLNASSSIGSLSKMPFAEPAADFSTVGNGSDIYGIGVALLTKDPVGLHFVDGATATRTRLEDNTSQAVTANTDVTMILTMDASGNYTYDLSGNAQTVASSGTISGFDLSENFHFVVGHQDNEILKTIRSVTLTASGSEDPYEIWAAAYGGEALIGVSTNDHDSDGQSNLAEFYFGGNPTNKVDQSHRPQIAVVSQGGSNALQFVYRKLANVPSGTSYQVECAGNLLNPAWTNIGTVVVGQGAVEGDSDYLSVTNELAVMGTNGFFRLIVIEP